MTVSTFLQPNNGTQSGSVYKGAIDAAAAVMKRIAAAFAPRQQATADMTVAVDAGSIYDVDGDALTEVSAANTATLTAPSVNPRKDIISVDEATGAITVTAGAEAASPVDPTIPAGEVPVARINWTTAMTEITNADLDDLRPGLFTGWLKPDGDGSNLTGIVSGATDAEKANIMLNAFRIAVNGGLSAQNMVDGVADEYEDETGVDTATSTNETYDATNDLYNNPGLTTTQSTSGAWEGSTANFSHTGDDITQTLADRAIKLTATQSADTLTELVSTFDAGTGNHIVMGFYDNAEDGSWNATNKDGGMNVMTKSWRVEPGGVYYGSSSVYTPSTASKEIKLQIDTTDGTVTYYEAGVLKFTFTQKANGIVTRIVRGGGGVRLTSDFGWTLKDTPLNMTLVSNATTALATPTDAFIVLWQEDVDAIMLNTDLKAYASRDGGTTWTQITLAEEATLTTGRILTGSVDISGQPSGTSMKYKIETLNAKEQKIHGVGLQWS